MKITGIIFLTIGIISLLIQNTFYGYVDTDGIVRDSLFLPLGAFATIIGLVLLISYGGKCLYKKFTK